MRIAWYRDRGAVAVVLPVAAAALVAACGSGQPRTSAAVPGGSPAAAASSASAAAAPAASSCSVVDQSEAGAALGQSVKAPILGRATVEGGIACVFYGPGVPPGTSPDIPVADSVRVVLVTGLHAKKWFDDYRTKVSARPISGLGDQAYYDGYASISVLRGDAYVRIAVGIASNLGAEETLARDALAKM